MINFLSTTLKTFKNIFFTPIENRELYRLLKKPFASSEAHFLKHIRSRLEKWWAGNEEIDRVAAKEMTWNVGSALTQHMHRRLFSFLLWSDFCLLLFMLAHMLLLDWRAQMNNARKSGVKWNPWGSLRPQFFMSKHVSIYEILFSLSTLTRTMPGRFVSGVWWQHERHIFHQARFISDGDALQATMITALFSPREIMIQRRTLRHSKVSQ